MSLERFCRKPLATASPAETALEVAERMRKQHVGCVVVTEGGGRPVGIVTDRDLVTRVLAERRDPAATPVKAAMSPAPVIAKVDERIEEAAMKMRQKGVRRLPIVDPEGTLIGMVSLDDLMVLFTAELGQAVQAVRDNRGP